MINYDKLPDYMQEGMKRYIKEGIRPGNFMYYILCNDFVRAVQSSDIANKHNLLSYAEWLNWEAPSACWGSVDKVERWMLAKNEEMNLNTISVLRRELRELGDRMHG